MADSSARAAEDGGPQRGVRPQFGQRGLRAVGPSTGLHGTPGATAAGSANRALSRLLDRRHSPESNGATQG